MTANRRRGKVLRRLLFAAMLVVLVALNAGWIVTDRVAPAMKGIDASINSGRFDEAERALRWRLRWSPGDGDARMKLARLMVKRGDNLGGARQLHEVPFWWPAKREATFLESQAFKQVARGRDAEAALQACLVDDPFHPIPPRMFHGAAKDLVAFYVLEGRQDEAREVLWRAFEEATPEEKPGVLATRVRLELERIDHAEAVGRLRDYLGADPDDPDARRALALEEHTTGDEAAADRDLATCLRARPDDTLAWRAKLEILNDRGDVEGLHEAVTRLPKAAERDARVCLYRGIDLQRRDDQAGALGAFRRAAELAPADAEILYKLGMAELAAGRAQTGKDHVARSRQLHQAFGTLRDGYQVFLAQSRKNPRDESAYRSAVETLAESCRTYGWLREADAWRSLLARR